MEDNSIMKASTFKMRTQHITTLFVISGWGFSACNTVLGKGQDEHEVLKGQEITRLISKSEVDHLFIV